jgi:eukaryotic-like serine/threonine-protein kinase
MPMKKVADYEVSQELGGGNGGHVFVCATPARLAGVGAQVAVKLIDQPVSESELRVVAEELQRYVATGDPHLLTLHDVGLWNNRIYIAMEYCPLGSLEGAFGRLGADAIARAVSDAARAVHALHDAGIAHRNIKPSNILLQTDGGKLSDPGLLHLISPGQTVTGVGAAGAIEFMEPGVVRGERAARASDIWSLGACLHEALTGTSVYGALPDGSLLAALRHVLSNAATVNASVPEQWQDVVRRCVAPDRADRYATAKELAEDIDRVQGLVSA